MALGVSLPLILVNAPAFVNSAVTMHFRQPLRLDGLTYLAWWARNGGARLGVGAALAPVTAVVLLALTSWRGATRTPGGFAAATGLLFGVLFAFGKQAFCNYYYFVLGALCVAIAATTPRHEA